MNTHKRILLVLTGTLALVTNALAGFEFVTHSKQGTVLGHQRLHGSSLVYGASFFNNTATQVYVNSYEFAPISGDWTHLSVRAGNTLISSLGRPLRDHGLIGSSQWGGMFMVDLLDEANTSGGERTGLFTLRGGATPTSNDVLGVQPMLLDLYPDYGGLTTEVQNPTRTLAPGETSKFHVTINNGLVTTWMDLLITLGPSTTQVFTHYLDSPVRANYNRHLVRGEVWESDAIDAAAAPLAPPGQAEFTLHTFGGRYFEDQDFLTSDLLTVHVAVPEPGSLISLTLGLCALLRRRRRPN